MSSPLKTELYRLARGCGVQVSECRLVKDPRTHESRGFGFVTMGNLADAEYAVRNLNRSTLEGRAIVVEKVGGCRPSAFTLSLLTTPDHSLGLASQRQLASPPPLINISPPQLTSPAHLRIQLSSSALSSQVQPDCPPSHRMAPPPCLCPSSTL